MNEKDKDQAFLDAIKSELDQSVYNIDAATVSRITQARYQAIEKKSKNIQFAVWLPAGAIASACVALVIYTLATTSTQIEQESILDEVELISELDLFENLEFYEWLEEYELPS